MPLWAELKVFDLLIIIPEARFTAFRMDNSNRITSMQLGTQVGRLHDGRKFRLVVVDRNNTWLETIRGIRFREYEIQYQAKLTAYELASIQAMMQS